MRLNGDDQRMRYGGDRIEMEVNGKETDSDEIKNLIASIQSDSKKRNEAGV
ncbi:serine dehydratase [Prevotella nigrescens]|uniref:serine dehydratase n=1 Tax=Prevotella nigrescens TaxID=28133 RepID=UPI001C5CD011|nr:serine dehydratase [Prevotella nigrescens]MBW4726246.1 serine dehydratase [Prevotella nigrescens]